MDLTYGIVKSKAIAESDIKTWINTQLNSSTPYQCLKFVQIYINKFFPAAINQIKPFTGTAKVWQNNTIPQNWTPIYTSDINQARYGDIVVTKGAYIEYGHIGIAIGNGKMVDANGGANYNLGAGTRPAVHSITGLVRIIRPNLVTYKQTVAEGLYNIAAYNSKYVIDINNGTFEWGRQLELYENYSEQMNQVILLTKCNDEQSYKITMVKTGLVLEINGHGLNNGDAVIQYQWCDHNNQKWYIQDVGGGYYNFINKNSGKSLNVTPAFQNNAKINQNTYSGATTQKFKLINRTYQWKYANTKTNQNFRIATVNQDFAVDVASGSTKNGTKLQIWQNDNPKNTNRIFNIQRQFDDGSYVITYKGKAFDVIDATVKNGEDVILYDAHKGSNQRWYLLFRGNGTFCFINKNSGQALDISDGKFVNGSIIQQFPSHAGISQTFRLIEA